MFNSGILDVAIGLIFVYLLLSLVCTAISEIIEAKLKMRAVDLERGIRELLRNKDDLGLVQKFYEHPLIFSLFVGSYDPGKVDAKTQRYAKGSNLPSYIPSRNFALALMDLMLPANSSTDGTSTPSGAAGATAPPPDTPNPPGLAGAAALPPAPAVPKPLQPLRQAISEMNNEHVKRALLPLVDAAGDDVSKARENIEVWYDSTMDRVSGWYKRRAQWIILGLGLGVAIVVNADTITIGNSLSHDVSMRNALVAAAQEFARIHPASPPVPPPGASPGSVPAPGGVNPVPPPTPRPNKTVIAEVCKNDKDSPVCIACTGDANSPACTACLKDENSPECRVARNLSQIRQLGLPVGWDTNDTRTVPRTFWGWVTKVLGWLVTATAISLGAPLWFDLLNKIMVVRSTVRPWEKSPEEPPVDRG